MEVRGCAAFRVGVPKDGWMAVCFLHPGGRGRGLSKALIFARTGVSRREDRYARRLENSIHLGFFVGWLLILEG